MNLLNLLVSHYLIHMSSLNDSGPGHCWRYLPIDHSVALRVWMPALSLIGGGDNIVTGITSGGLLLASSPLDNVAALSHWLLDNLLLPLLDNELASWLLLHDLSLLSNIALSGLMHHHLLSPFDSKAPLLYKTPILRSHPGVLLIILIGDSLCESATLRCLLRDEGLSTLAELPLLTLSDASAATESTTLGSARLFYPASKLLSCGLSHN